MASWNMGSRPILPVKGTITFDTMFNEHGHADESPEQ